LRAKLMRRGAMMRHYNGDPHAGNILRSALEMAKKVGSDQTVADAYFSYGLYLSDPREVIENLEESLRMFELIGDETGIYFCLAGIGEIAYVDGDLSTSRTFFALSVERAQKSGDLRSAGASIGAIAAIDLREGKINEACEGLVRGLNLAMETRAVFSIYSMFPLVVECIQHRGLLNDAAQLLGWSEKLRKSVGGSRDRMGQFIYERVDKDLREQLGAREYADVLADGAALNVDDAISLAMSCLSRGSR